MTVSGITSQTDVDLASFPQAGAVWVRIKVTADTYPDGNVDLTQEGISLGDDATGIAEDTIIYALLDPAVDLEVDSSDWTNADNVALKVIPALPIR